MISKINVEVGGKAYGWRCHKEQVSGLLLVTRTAWIYPWFNVALLFAKVNKSCIQSHPPFSTSREVPMLTENHVFFFSSAMQSICSSDQQQIPWDAERKSGAVGTFLHKCWSSVVLARFLLIANLNKSEGRMFVNAFLKLFIKALFICWRFQREGKIKGGLFQAISSRQNSGRVNEF